MGEFNWLLRLAHKPNKGKELRNGFSVVILPELTPSNPFTVSERAYVCLDEG